MGGEAALAVALAGSLFFKVDPAEGRDKVLLGLLLTMAPFALVGPFIGPFVDRVRGGHRAVMIGSLAARAVIGLLLFPAAAAGSLLVFPEAFAMLVLGKTYQVARAAMVPSVVGDEMALVEANSKLQIIGGLSGFVAAAPAGLGMLIGPEWAVAVCVVCFSAAAVAALRLPAVATPDAEADAVEDAADASPAIRGERVAMAGIRTIVGLVTMLCAFALRGGNASGEEWPQWYFGVVVALAVVGGLVGASLAPRLRERLAEERILLGAVLTVFSVGLVAVLTSGLAAFSTLAFGAAVASATGKQAFDSLVQRGTPDLNRGRLFARFEAQFQVAWVLGALVPVAIHMSVSTGGILVCVVALVALAAFLAGDRPIRGQASSSNGR
jgi:hypothetical protein